MRDGDRRRDQAAPGMTEKDRPVKIEAVQNADRVGYMLGNGERPV
jgi:hypothetical protein